VCCNTRERGGSTKTIRHIHKTRRERGTYDAIGEENEESLCCPSDSLNANPVRSSTDDFGSVHPSNVDGFES
jgi:hypothetical protein